MDATEYRRWIESPFVDEHLAGDHPTALIVVDPDEHELPDPGSLPVIIATLGNDLGAQGPTYADLIIGPRDEAHLTEVVERAPLAATTLAVLLRALPSMSIEHGLAMESAAYSMLQAGPEFARWQANSLAPRPMDEDTNGPTVRVDRDDDRLVVTLDRPARHNAVSRRLRDDLTGALSIAVADPSIDMIELRGAGPSFCSGGDLAEFGLRPDPASAHVVRLARSPARLLHRLSNRVVAHLHGHTLGGGIEMAAFAHHVIAAPDTVMGLPEINLGLIPGAGGTVSLTRRIGRQRTAALALATNSFNDIERALDWRLIDEVNPSPSATGQ